MTFQPSQGSASDMPAESWPLAVTKLTELQELFAHRCDICFVGIQRRAESNRHAVANCFRQFRKESPALEGKDRTPELIKPDRYDRCLGLSGDDLVTAPQSQQRPGARQFAFWEHADDFAGADPRRGLSHPILRFASGDWNAAHRAEDRIQDRVSINTFVDDETNGARTSQRENDRVDPGNVIRQKEESALR